jgi:hypothetical protein
MKPNFYVVFAGQTMTNFEVGSTFMANATPFRWRMRARVVCLSVGSTGTFSSLINGEISVAGADLTLSGGSSANATGAFVQCDAAGTYTVDTTQSQGLKIQAGWSGTTGAPVLTKRVAMQRKIGVG